MAIQQRLCSFLVMRFHQVATYKIPACLQIPLIHSRQFHVSHCRRDIFNIQDNDDFNERVLKSKLPVVVDFHASWCGPCKLLAPRLENTIAALQGKVHLAKVDIDDNTDLAMEYGVTAVPAVIGIRKGQNVDKFVGLQDEDVIESFVNKLVGK